MTGTPRALRNATVSAISSPPSSFTAVQQVYLVVNQTRQRGGIGGQADELVAAFAAADLCHRQALWAGLDAHDSSRPKLEQFPLKLYRGTTLSLRPLERPLRAVPEGSNL